MNPERTRVDLTEPRSAAARFSARTIITVCPFILSKGVLLNGRSSNLVQKLRFHDFFLRPFIRTQCEHVFDFFSQTSEEKKYDAYYLNYQFAVRKKFVEHCTNDLVEFDIYLFAYSK